MRASSCTWCIKKIIWPLVLVLLSACATTTGRYKHLPPKRIKIEHKRAPETGARKEIIRSEPKVFAAASTPKAKASANMVEAGRRELANANFEPAERIFQEAINIDPSNGVAYYYLARAQFELGLFGQSSGVLDKAEELLAGSKEWMEAVATLQEMIKEAYKR